MAIKVENITFKSKAYTLKGRTYRPEKEGKYPAVAICHGYPGRHQEHGPGGRTSAKRDSCAVFYYQGAWSSEGTYRFCNLTPSTVDAVKYLKISALR